MLLLDAQTNDCRVLQGKYSDLIQMNVTCHVLIGNFVFLGFNFNDIQETCQR